MTRNLKFIDVTMRDAHQCLWATRMTTSMMKELAPRLDNAGFEAIDLVGGAVFDVCVRFLREDPWERMRILNQWVTKTPLIIHTRGQCMFTFEFFPDDVVELAAERFAANGMRYHTVYDPLNDTRNLKIPIQSARNLGIHTVPGLVYTFSPVHTDAYYVKKAKELLTFGIDGLFIKDPSGLLTPERVATLVPALKAAIGDLPLQLHTHCLSGLGPYVSLQAVKHGVDVLHTATSTLANAASHPATESMVRDCLRRGYDVDLDLASIHEVAERLEYIAKVEGKPVGAPVEYDEFHYHHQVAGGMISNLKVQLEGVGLAHRIEEILEEAGRVRAELGYPIVVSPFAQYIITQSVLNVTAVDQGRERYDNVPDEVRLYARGGYGEIAGEIKPNLYDKISGGADQITERPGALVEPSLGTLRKKRGPFASDDDLLLAAFYDEGQFSALKAAGPINTDSLLGATPMLTLLKEVAHRPSVKTFHFIDNREG
ncbi:oxaloacetate decarboxylase, alpha subunit [Shimia gijangensis]|uniref:Oxaloacetate decarboxylase, alpha subunit n=1 Tax=Shimia gijangensis TaxID=1470563 RepID=A0A1M6T7S9_9RHOB|nr:pyruvate carboxylase subunit B [Shimia gijangensis]SHK53051.1 oxaloacetate decarboxylase, alpha subunit [Shimia gijangensis]